MNFRQFEAFRAIITHGSVTQAAESLHVSQPAVSRLLADLEASLNLRLFERDRGRLRPTPEAHVLFQDSNMAFSGLARLRETAQSLGQLRRGRLRVVSETVHAEGLLPRLAAGFQLLHPEVRLELDTGPSARIVEWMAEAWYDLGIVVLPVPDRDVRLEVLRRQVALCALPPDHPLTRHQIVRLRDLSGERIVAPARGGVFRLLFDRATKSLDPAPDIRLEMRTQHGICAAVAAGAGVGIVDPCAAEEHAGAAVFRPIEPEVAWDLASVIPKIRAPSLLCQHFGDYIRNA